MSLRKYNFLIIILFLAIAVVLIVAINTLKENVLKVVFFDVGQGDAIFIEAPNGNQMLIDGGRDAQILRRLGTVMPFYDRFIDVVLATHPDADHIGGLALVLSRYNVGLYLEPGSKADTASYLELKKLISEKEIKTILARRGMKVNFGDGAVFDILFPDRDVTFLETNTSSIVGRLSYGTIDFMLTGDSPKSIENYLVSIDGGRLESEVLKAGHHGSRTSSEESFVRKVSPQFAIISAGLDNRYGHPHEEVISLFKKLDIETLGTATLGSITFTSDGASLWLK